MPTVSGFFPEEIMNQDTASFWLNVVGVGCWGVCFWWMKRISTEQNLLIGRLREQGKRIESLSKIEHDLIKEVHPQVGEIKEGLDEMIAAVKENSEEITAAVRESAERTAPAPEGKGADEPPRKVPRDAPRLYDNSP